MSCSTPIGVKSLYCFQWLICLILFFHYYLLSYPILIAIYSYANHGCHCRDAFGVLRFINFTLNNNGSYSNDCYVIVYLILQLNFTISNCKIHSDSLSKQIIILWSEST